MGTFFCDLFFGAHIFFTVFSKLGVGGTSYRNYNFFSSIDVISKTEQLDQLCIVWSLGMMMMMEIVAKRSPRLSDRNIWTHNQQTYTNNLRRRKKHASSKKTCLIASKWVLQDQVEYGFSLFSHISIHNVCGTLGEIKKKRIVTR